MQTQMMLLVLLCDFNRINKVKGSVVLKSVPPTAADGELLTLVCSKSTPDHSHRDVSWYRDGAKVFVTKRSSAIYNIDSSVRNSYRSGRINVHCDALQHNVTIRINSTIDNGTTWCCRDATTSNTVMINVESKTSWTTTTRTTVMSSLATTDTTSIQTDKPDCDELRDVLYLVATGVGGVVFGSIVCVAIFITWFKKCRKRDANLYDSTYPREDMGHLYCPVQAGTEAPNYVNTEAANVTSDVAADAGDTHYYSFVGTKGASRDPLLN
ncbi:uncharacterized protein LOC124287312 [Haliotis rubra]|uniref:uncharacterized protein LOC124287312 n=1 Tax=Haliotis rubra TaxID=36100 RepID=UPI001EE59F29|nr:uncharacterized protein LOC124287312 [Haliotis rubra]